ncbi:MAG: xanthine dehydrogenase family protein subunit M [Alphaproteobacteria bacterium]|nr:xanthine dehydrogenase family protein subunit M [Alphaproteobacteria bacterium]
MVVSVRTYDQVGEAANALSSDREAYFLAGGTLLMRGVNEGSRALSTLVRTTDSSLRQIQSSGSRIEIGAAATMSDILANRELSFLHPAARAVGGPAIRNMATAGGNLFARTPYGDLTTAFLVLDAMVNFAGGSQAQLPLGQFLAEREKQPRPLVAGISIERPTSAAAFRFLKVSRVKPERLSVMCMAALLPQSGGRVQGARVAYGAMAPTPIRMTAVEQALEGVTLDESGVQAAAAAANTGASPATDAIASEWYRREVAPVHLKRLLLGQGS